MRVASRTIGILLALAGIAFLAVSYFIVASGFHSKSVIVEAVPDRSEWMAGAFSAALGVGFLLAGLYFIKLNIDKLGEAGERPGGRFTAYFLSHRREATIIAQTGLLVSLIRTGAAFCGVDWPGKSSVLPLYLVSIAFLIIASQIGGGGTAIRLNWDQVPGRMRPVLRIIWRSVGPGIWILGILFAWNEWHRQVSPPVIQDGFVVIFFAWGTMFFRYGDITIGKSAG